LDHPEQLDFTKNLNQYNQRVLFAYSELNTAYGKQHAELVSAPLSLVDLVEIKGCGHEIPEFGWENYYTEIKKYLTKML